MNVRSASRAFPAGFVLLTSWGALSSSSCESPTGGGGGGGPSGPCGAKPADDDYAGCATCTWSSSANPGEGECTRGRSVNACCDWVQEPTLPLARAVGLHAYSFSTSSPVDVGCLTHPPPAGAVHRGTLTGHVKIFSTGTDTAGVTVRVSKVNTKTGALGAQVGTTYTTSSDTKVDPYETNTWLYSCSGSVPCAFRQYAIEGVPTETPLVVQTFDPTGLVWANLYDYGVYFTDAAMCSTTPPGAPCIASSSPWTMRYDVTAIAPGDIQALANDGIGINPDPSLGVLLGEVHDCGDVRVAAANADTDQAHNGPLLYFDSDETDPVPDSLRGVEDVGTSSLGLFGALDVAPGVPIRVSAIGKADGKDTLLGTSVVQVFAGPAVTFLTLRGRAAYQ